MKQKEENYRRANVLNAKREKSFIAFIDLAKAFDRVLFLDELSTVCYMQMVYAIKRNKQAPFAQSLLGKLNRAAKHEQSQKEKKVMHRMTVAPAAKPRRVVSLVHQNSLGSLSGGEDGSPGNSPSFAQKMKARMMQSAHAVEDIGYRAGKAVVAGMSPEKRIDHFRKGLAEKVLDWVS